MATRKTTRKKGVGAAPARRTRAAGGTMNLALGVIGGAIAAKFAGGLVKKMLPTAPPMIAGLAPLALGLVLAPNKNVMLAGAGYGMIAVGGGNLAEALIPGIGQAEDDVLFLGEGDDEFLNEPADMSLLSEPADMSVLAGTEEETEDMMMNGFDESYEE